MGFKYPINIPKPVLGVKSVIQNVVLPPEFTPILECFQRMTNDCIRIGLMEGVTSLKSLSLKSYHKLDYKIYSQYKLCAISAATGILKNHRRSKRRNPNTKIPHAKKLRLTTCYGFKIINGSVRIPLQPREYAYIPLNDHTLKVLSEPGLHVRSITLTPSTISICYSHECAEVECAGQTGIDRNLDNVTTASTDGGVAIYDLSKATEIKATYREVKSHFRRNDDRIRKKIYRKYGIKQRNRVNTILHKTSKAIVEEAKVKQIRPVMEKLTGIRKLYRKGNGQGNGYRSRLNSWSFYELQRQIEYKAKWEGLSIVYVDPRGSSVKCSVCGSRTRKSGGRTIWCPECGAVMNRDINAARNLVARGVRFAPVGGAGEAMVPVQRWPVDAPQPSQVITL